MPFQLSSAGAFVSSFALGVEPWTPACRRLVRPSLCSGSGSSTRVLACASSQPSSPSSGRPCRRRRVQHSQPLPSTLSDALAALRELDPNGEVPDYATLHRVAVEFAASGDALSARDALFVIERLGEPARRGTSAIVLGALGRKRLTVEAEELLDRLWSRQLKTGDGTESIRLSQEQWNARRPDPKMVVTAADCAVRAGRVDIAARLISKMESNGFPSSLHALSVLLKGYGRARRPEDVRKILQVCRRRNLRPDLILLNSAIDALMRCGDFSGARHILTNDFAENSIEPNHLSFHPILRGLARAGRVKDVHKIYGHMAASGVEPDKDTLNALISACVHSNDFDGARHLLNESLKSAAAGMAGTSEVTSTSSAVEELTSSQCVAYTTVISGLALTHRTEEALALLAEMVERFHDAPSQNVELQVSIALSSITSALLKQNCSEQALVLFYEARTRYHIRSTPDTHKAIMRGLCNARNRASVEAAYKIFDEMYFAFMLQDSKVPDAIPGDESSTSSDTNTEPHASSNIGTSKRLQEPRLKPKSNYSELFVTLVSVDDMIAAFNILIDGYARVDDMNSAEDLLNLMKQSSLSPDVVTFTSLIGGYGRSQDMVNARRTFLDMRARRILPDKVAMNAFIGACVNCGNRELAVLIFDEMQRVGGYMSPDLTTFSGMIALYIRSGDVGAAWDAYEELKGMGLVPNERIMHRMMAAFVSRKSHRDSEHEVRIGLDASMTSAALKAAVEEYQSYAKDTPLGEELAKSFIDRETSGGWNSDRVALLLHDMEQINVPARTRARWQEALSRAWSV
jgi:pentatricopeptide repeat protein